MFKLLYMLTVAVHRSSSDDSVIRYVLPVLWMTSCFHIMGQIQMQAWSLRRSELFTISRQVSPLNCASGDEVCYLLPVALFIAVMIFPAKQTALLYNCCQLLSVADSWKVAIVRLTGSGNGKIISIC